MSIPNVWGTIDKLVTQDNAVYMQPLHVKISWVSPSNKLPAPHGNVGMLHTIQCTK